MTHKNIQEAIEDVKRAQAICDALNKIFWKVPPIKLYDEHGKELTAEGNARWWLAELADADISGIAFNDNNIFEPAVPSCDDVMLVVESCRATGRHGRILQMFTCKELEDELKMRGGV